ncbi:hydroxymethylglutaryl-CoA reductase [Verrucomicrobiota bacterium]
MSWNTDTNEFASVPMQWVGPAKITGSVMNEDVMLPLATYEAPLWPSVNRGARVSAVSGGIQCTLVDERMSRSVILEAPDAAVALDVLRQIEAEFEQLVDVVGTTSRFAKLKDMHSQIVGNLLYLRFEIFSGDASGHNMVTNASEALLNYLLGRYPQMQYGSISGNFCTDKKASAVNGILGRGKYVVAEGVISKKFCARYLKTTPEKVVQLNIKKNLIGTMIAGGLRSANAHVANMLLGFYLATGQDAANIVEGSQAITYADVRGEDLYFSVTLPNLIVGTVGNGKHLPFVRDVMAKLGCDVDRAPGENARRLAVICAASVWCGELSLMAAQTNPGELMQAHRRIERKQEA